MKTSKQLKEVYVSRTQNKQSNLFIQFVKKPFCSLIIMLLLPLGMIAQSETIYQNWTMIDEDEGIMIEVSGKVLKCNLTSPAQLYIEIFNESSVDQVAHFNITITNPLTNEEGLHEISLPVLKAEIVKPNCGNNDYPSLRINIPNGWDPATVQYSLTFIN